MSWLGNVFKSVGDVAKGVVSVVPGVGNYLGSMESADAVRDANDKNLQAVRETNAANLSLWEKQTAYNTPENQMKRLEAAGLNPNLAYGTIAESRMGTAPMMQAPHYEAPRGRDYSGFSLAEYQQIVNQHEQNKLIRINADKVAAEADRAKSDAKYTRYENDMLMSQGLLKSDSPIIKPVGRVKDYVKQNVVGPVGKAISGSSLWQGISDAVSRLSSGIARESNTGWRTRHVERYGKGGK